MNNEPQAVDSARPLAGCPSASDTERARHAQQESPQKFAVVRRHVAELESDADAGETSLGHRHYAAGLVSHGDGHPSDTPEFDVLRASDQDPGRADINQVPGESETAPQKRDGNSMCCPEPFCASTRHVWC